MVDFLKNAFGAAFTANPGSGTHSSNEFVGQQVDVGPSKYRIRRLIAEGGFAYVYEAQEVPTGNSYAVKRLLATDEAKTKEIVNEISIMKKLSGHPNIVRFCTAASIDKQASSRGMVEFIVVMELCPLGRLVDVIAKRGARKLTIEHICQIMYQTLSAVQCCHNQQPPIVHRDLKLENLLLDARSIVKLCDFGSATTQQYEPDSTWTAAKRSIVEDEITRNTTPMYRSPEMIDTYQNAPIGTMADIWMLGCIIYTLCFERHPFDDSAKLKILNANYTIPASDRDYVVFHELIRMMLQVDPRVRPEVDLVLAAVEQIAHETSARNGQSVKLDSPVDLLPNSVLPQANSQPVPAAAAAVAAGQPQAGGAQRQPPPRPPPLASSVSTNQPSNATASSPPAAPPRDVPEIASFRSDRSDFSASGGGSQPSVLSALKSGAGAFFTKVKDASSRVKDAMQSNMGATHQPGTLDLSYLTSRLLVMSYPSENLVEQALRANNAVEVRNFLDRNHFDTYAVYNLSMKSYPMQRFADRVQECAMNPKRAPPLAMLVALAKNLHAWLRQNRTNCAVIHCADGKIVSCMFVCAFLCFERFFDNVDACLTFFARRRVAVQLTPSQRRYVNYMIKIVHPEQPLIPQRRFFKLISLTIKPVPLFNRTRNGCRPYLEVFRGQEPISSSVGDSNFDSIRIYASEHGQVQFELNTIIYGDITICCNHARMLNTAVANRFASAKVFDLQFHTGYLDVRQRFVHFEKQDLDYVDSPDKYPEGFFVAIEIEAVLSDEERQRLSESESARTAELAGRPPLPARKMQDAEMPWDTLPKDLDPRIICQSDEEFQNILGTFGSLNRSPGLLEPYVSSVNESYYAQLPLRRDAAAAAAAPSAPPRNEIYADRFSDVAPAQTVSNNRPSAPPLTPPSATRVQQPDTNFFELLDWETGPSLETDTPSRNRSATLDQRDEMLFPDFSLFSGTTLISTEERPQPTDVDVDDLIDVGDSPKTTAPPASAGPTATKASATLDELFASVSTDSSASDSARAVPTEKPSAGNTPYNLLDFADDRQSAFDLLRDTFTSTNPSSAAARPVSVAAAPTQAASLLDDFVTTKTAGNVPAAKPNFLIDDLFSDASTNIATKPIQPQAAAAKPTSPLRNPLLGAPLSASSRNTAASQPDLTRLNISSTPTNTSKADPFGSLFSGTANPAKPNIAPKPQFATSNNPQPTPNFTTQTSRQPPTPPKPNYDANLFSDARKISAPGMGYTGIKMPSSTNDFADLLQGQVAGSGGRGFTPGKAKLSDMLVAKEIANMTPDEAKVYAWVYGKKTNLRGMLSTLQTVITWQTDRWTPVALHDLVQPEQVRRYYKRACLAVHPDKLGDESPYQNLGRLILMELNKAHEDFEKNELEAEMQTPAS